MLITKGSKKAGKCDSLLYGNAPAEKVTLYSLCFLAYFYCVGQVKAGGIGGVAERSYGSQDALCHNACIYSQAARMLACFSNGFIAVLFDNRLNFLVQCGIH